MTLSLFANPGQTVTLPIQVLNSDGLRADGYQAPTIDFVRFPSGSLAAGYPVEMDKLETGLYKRTITLPTGSTALGTFLVSASWPHPNSSIFQYEVFMIQVALPFGNSSVSPA